MTLRHAQQPAARDSVRRPWPRRAAIGVIGGALSVLPATSPARAGILRPGDSAIAHAGDFVEPRGVLVAEQELGFTLNYDSPAGPAAPSVSGTLIDSVLRDPTDNSLTFIYNARLDSPDESGVAKALVGGSGLTVFGFSNRGTDVSGIVDGGGDAGLSRSADGASVTLTGGGMFPLLVVHTNATEVDANGAARFAVNSPAAPGIASAWLTGSGTAEIAGVFQPAVIAPTAVPLPPGLFTALGAAGGCGIIAAFRRWMGTPK